MTVQGVNVKIKNDFYLEEIKMTKYKIKNFAATSGPMLNKIADEWITSRNHISIKNINIWYDSVEKVHYAKIMYIENIYVG